LTFDLLRWHRELHVPRGKQQNKTNLDDSAACLLIQRRKSQSSLATLGFVYTKVLNVNQTHKLWLVRRDRHMTRIMELSGKRHTTTSPPPKAVQYTRWSNGR